MSRTPDASSKNHTATERSYSNQSRKQLPSDHDYNEKAEKPYAQNRVSVPEHVTEQKEKGEAQESPKLHQKEKPAE